MPSFEDLEIYCLAFSLARQVHTMSLTLPSYELFEQGSQIRRASKSIKDKIAEGYGRRRYKSDFIRFLTYAHASNNEVISQLAMIKETHPRVETLSSLRKKYVILSKKIYQYRKRLESG